MLAVGTGTPNTPSTTPSTTPDSGPGASGRSILQESFWRHSQPQLRARTSAVHPAVDWLYPALAAVAAVEGALLHPSSGLTYDPQADAQVCVHHLMSCRRQAHVHLHSLSNMGNMGVSAHFNRPVSQQQGLLCWLLTVCA